MALEKLTILFLLHLKTKKMKKQEEDIKSENNDVRNDLKRFRAEIERLLSDEVAKIKEPVQIP